MHGKQQGTWTQTSQKQKNSCTEGTKLDIDSPAETYTTANQYARRTNWQLGSSAPQRDLTFVDVSQELENRRDAEARQVYMTRFRSLCLNCGKPCSNVQQGNFRITCQVCYFTDMCVNCTRQDFLACCLVACFSGEPTPMCNPCEFRYR